MPEALALLPPVTLARLEAYRLVRRRPLRGATGGLRPSRQKGGSVEFTDFRDYTPGDDPRRVDWKAYARLRRLYIKEYADDRQDCVLFLLDNSASMGSGNRVAKGVYAAQVLAGLFTCALAGQDRPLITVSPASGKPFFRPDGGRGSLPAALSFLESISFGGRAALARDLETTLRLAPAVRSLYLFSDLYDLESIAVLLRLAGARGLETTLLHTLDPEEWHPTGEGDWTFVDSENEERLDVTLTPQALAAYSRRLQEFVQELDALCRRWAARRVPLNSGEGYETTLFRTLPRAGVIRPR